jgi:hypothetical protein
LLRINWSWSSSDMPIVSCATRDLGGGNLGQATIGILNEVFWWKNLDVNYRLNTMVDLIVVDFSNNLFFADVVYRWLNEFVSNS